MNWLAPIDLYCERTGTGFWSEPLNAFSNAAFLIAAAVLARSAWRRDWPVLALAFLVAVIGLGSFLFHTFANRWSLLADVIPITVFVHAYFFLAMRRFFGLAWPWALLVVAAFLIISLSVEALLPPDFLNGSGGYLAPWAAMLLVGALIAAEGRAGGGTILLAGLVFTLSLGFRIFDRAVCVAVPIGLHFLWHILNAVTLGLLLDAAAARVRTMKRLGRE
jgi:hypothetical protein